MQTTFLNRHLEELYATGRSRKYRLPADVVLRFLDRVNALRDAETIHDLQQRPSLNFEALHGTDRFSVRVNRQYRLEFTMKWTDGAHTVGVAGIVELSNHYA